jgi:hypothetical protein
MSEKKRDSVWRWVLLVGVLSAIPLLPASGEYPVVGFSMWAIVVFSYLALLMVYGAGFVVEGGCFAFILTMLLLSASPWFLAWLYDPPEGRVEDTPLFLLLVLAAMGLFVAVLSVGEVVARYLDRRLRRLRRLYEEADIRLIGGLWDGRTVDPEVGGHKWPPPPEIRITTTVTGDAETHIYQRTNEGAYRFSRTVPGVQ